MAQFKDKTPPHDEELERATLGSLLSDNEAVDAAIEQHLKEGDFYSRANQRIFKAVLSLNGKGLRADIQTVVQELKSLGILDEAGGAAYISSLTTVIPSGANIDYYAQTVQNYSLRRELLRVASEISVEVYDESKESRAVLEEVQQKLFKLSDEGQTFSSRKIGEVLMKTFDIIEKAYRSKQRITGIPSGFEELDNLTSGFQPSDFIVIGARPSVGKTALALNMASFIGFTKKIPLAFFSLEMSNIALTQRLISSAALVDGNNLRSGFLAASDYKKVLDTINNIYESPFYIVDMPNMKMPNLRSQARKLRSQQKVEILFIDYLGLIGYEGHSVQRFDQFSEISRSLKSLARELGIPVVVLCQLNRDAQWELPTLANLRDSGSIEQDADLVLFLHRERKKGKKGEAQEEAKEEQAHPDVIPTDLIIAKQRNGPVDTVKLELHSRFARFFPLSKEH